jgi:S-adenosylmethionine synthetase
MNRPKERTAEHVGKGHPDKFADQVVDAILDESYRLCGENPEDRARVRTALECVVKDNLLFISGEMKLPVRVAAVLHGLDRQRPEDRDITTIARDLWRELGYHQDSAALTVLNHIRPQSPDIATGGGPTTALGVGCGTDDGGAGDQGIMSGYSTSETPEMLPREYVRARDLCLALHRLRTTAELPWLGSDCKSQVTMSGTNVRSVIIAAQHAAHVPLEQVRAEVLARVVRPVLGDVDPRRVKVNGTGKFVLGGPAGDAGVVGRKIAVDHYGPLIPVGGGAFSGKDPTKVDRSAAYMARHIAKAVVVHQVGGAQECLVQLSYGIGQFQPEMISAVTQDGTDVSEWVRSKFTDLSPGFIIDYLGLRRPVGWSYVESAAFGHFGRPQFPWEAVPRHL